MAKFDAKSFNEKAFGKYMSAIPNVKLNKLRESRAIVGDARLRDTFVNNSQTGTVYAVLPFFGLLSGTPQNYDGVDNVTPGKTDTYEQGVFTYGRMNGWTEADFSYDVTGGTDFMANVRNQINDYWNGVDQDVILAILEGVFGMKDTGTGDIKKANAAFVEAHTYDIAQAGAEHTDDTMKMDATTLNSAIQKACGDNKQKFKLVYCHSAVATNLENLKLLAYLKYTDAQGIERDLEMGTWNGRLVIIDDSLPTKVVEAVAEDTGKNIKAQDAYTEYTTYILGEGAIGNYFSQYDGNFFLSGFDHWIKEVKRVKHYYRYMDDICIFARTKEELHQLLAEINEYFIQNLKLRIKGNYQIFPSFIRGIDFVGYRIFLKDTLLRKSTCQEFERKMTAIRKKIESGQEMNYSEWCAINSYKGWLKYCDSSRLSEKYIEPIQPYADRYYKDHIKKGGKKHEKVRKSTQYKAA